MGQAVMGQAKLMSLTNQMESTENAIKQGKEERKKKSEKQKC